MWTKGVAAKPLWERNLVYIDRPQRHSGEQTIEGKEHWVEYDQCSTQVVKSSVKLP